MTVEIHFTTDCTQQELVHDLACIIYRRLGYVAPQNVDYFLKSQHPTEIAVLAAAEDIFELLTADRPDYAYE